MRKAWIAAPALLLALTLSAQTSSPSSGSQGSAGQTSTSPSSTQDQNQATPPSSSSQQGSQTGAQTPSTSDQGATSGAQGAQGNTGANATGKKLPQTASPLPLLGLLGIGSLAAGLFQRRKR